jgi:hypothetical protein
MDSHGPECGLGVAHQDGNNPESTLKARQGRGRVRIFLPEGAYRDRQRSFFRVLGNPLKFIF